jgi:DNA polymerase-3 subunit alpha
VEFEVEGEAIRFGLNAIKGCGRAVIEGMVAAREAGGAFADIFDFCDRVQDQTMLNKNAVECLIKAGAFSSISGNRAQLLQMLPDAMSSAAAKLRNQKAGQAGLFGEDSGAISGGRDLSRYNHIGDFSRDDILAMEKDLVGLYLSGHPLENVRDLLAKHCTATASDFRELENDQECVVGGIVADIRIRMTRRNEKMAQVRLEDLYGTIPITFFPNAFKSCADQLVKDRVVLVKGKVNHRERLVAEDGDTTVEVEIRGESVSPVRNGIANGNGKPNGGSRTVHIKINGVPAVKLELLKSLLEANAGASPVYFWMRHAETNQKVSTQFKVEATTRFVGEVERLLGKDVVRVS